MKSSEDDWLTGDPEAIHRPSHAALIATIGVSAPVLIYFVIGDRSRPLLDAIKTWLARNNAVIIALLLLLIGLKLIAEGISGLSGLDS